MMDFNRRVLMTGFGVMAGVLWTLQNPKRGECFAENLPHDEVLRWARPYLGRIVSQPSDWTPLRRDRVYFGENPAAQPDHSDLWQFTHFLFRP